MHLSSLARGLGRSYARLSGGARTQHACMACGVYDAAVTPHALQVLSSATELPHNVGVAWDGLMLNTNYVLGGVKSVRRRSHALHRCSHAVLKYTKHSKMLAIMKFSEC